MSPNVASAAVGSDATTETGPQGPVSFSASFSAICAVAVALASLPLLAPVAISGDGLEIVSQLERGGALHPPGFPLQSALQALLRHMPFGTGTFRVELLCVLGHALAVFFIAEAARAAGLRRSACVAAAAAVGFFPTVWPLAVQPEVFALAHALIAALIWHCVRLWRTDHTPSSRDAVVLGVLVALAGAQHPITLTAAPVFIGALAALLVRPAGRWRRLALAAVPFSILFCGLYLSLLLHNDDAIWPNWRVADVGDVVAHALRRTYGTLQLSSAGRVGEPALFVLGGWCARVPLLPLLLVLGIAVLIRRRTPAATLVMTHLFAALVFLLFARIPEPSEPYLERFTGTAILPAALLLAAAVDAIPRAAARVGVVAVAVGWLAVVALPRTNLSERRELAVQRAALSLSLPADAVWIGASDSFIFGGAQAADETALRFPLNTNLRVHWYWSVAAPRIEPRLRFGGVHHSPARLAELAREAGFPVAAGKRSDVEPLYGRRLHRRGVLWVVDDIEGPLLDAQTVRIAVALCPLVRTLTPVPRDGPGFVRPVHAALARAFRDAAGAAGAPGELEGVSRALETGDSAAWRSACERLESGPPFLRAAGLSMPRP